MNCELTVRSRISNGQMAYKFHSCRAARRNEEGYIVPTVMDLSTGGDIPEVEGKGYQ